MLDPYEVRKDFPILERKIKGKPLIYLDNAATSQKPRQVIMAELKFYREYNANIHRGVHTLSQEASELYEEAHEEVASFINARTYREVVFTRNTTESINLVAYSWALRNLKREDEILTTIMEHHSNIVPWKLVSEVTGCKLRFVDVRDDGTLDYEDLESKISNKTRLIAIVHVSNVLGTINDIEYVVRLAHDYKSLVLVDGAQAAPHMPVDVKKLDVDFYAFSGHKMLGPTGIGVLYGKEELLESMPPFLGGGDMISGVKCEVGSGSCSIEWNKLPWKFEAGTPNIVGGVGLAEAVKYLKRLGMSNVRSYEEELVAYTLKRLGDIPEITVYGPLDPTVKSGVISFNVKGYNPHEVAALLDSEGIAVRSGYHCAQPLHLRIGAVEGSVRASFYIYNLKEEVDRLVEILEEIAG